MGFKKAHNSVRSKILCDILIECRILFNRVKLIKRYLHDTYSDFRIGKQSSDNFIIPKWSKTRYALWSLHFKFAVECAIRKIQEHLAGLKLDAIYQLLVYADRH
jgi:hypothetical protein